MVKGIAPYRAHIEEKALSNMILTEVNGFLWEEHRRSSTLDPFCGGNALALTAKCASLRVSASDILTRPAVVEARAFMARGRVRLTRERALGLFGQPRCVYAGVAAKHSLKVSDAAAGRRAGRGPGAGKPTCRAQTQPLLLIKLVFLSEPSCYSVRPMRPLQPW
jgi:hypothetical protein